MIKQWGELQIGDLLEWMDGADGPGHAIRLLRIKEEEDARFRGVPHLEDIPMLERDMKRFMSLEHKSLDTIRHMEHLNLRIVRAKQAQGIPLTDLDKLTLRIETKVL